MEIDWDAIKEKGDEGLLTAEEASALIRLARCDVLRREEDAQGLDICAYCWRPEHFLDDCPIATLEEASNAN
jgi:hypothetical protein